MNSPSSSCSDSSSSSPLCSILGTPQSIKTPATSQSVILDADIAHDPLDLIADDRNYILVVGGLGYIGSHTVLELLKEDYNVIVVDDLSNSYQNVLERVRFLATEFCKRHGRKMPILKFHEMDYRSPKMRSLLATYDSYVLRKTDRVKARTVSDADLLVGHESSWPRNSRISGVIHFAAFKSVEESIRKPLSYYLNNVCGLVDFLGVLEEFGVKSFVFSSSATVYGEKAERGIPLKEEDCVHHDTIYHDDDGVAQPAKSGVLGLTSPYGRSKFMCESILADVAKADPSWSITALRYFNPVGCDESGLLGEDPRQNPSNLFPVITSVLTGSRPTLSIFGTNWDTTDGTAVRDYIHVSDLSRGHIAALAASRDGRVRQPFRTFNLGTGIGHTVRQVHESLENASSRKIPFKEVDRRPGDVGFCVAEAKRAQIELNWRAEKSLTECAADVWNFSKAQCSSKDHHE